MDNEHCWHSRVFEKNEEMCGYEVDTELKLIGRGYSCRIQGGSSYSTAAAF